MIKLPMLGATLLAFAAALPAAAQTPPAPPAPPGAMRAPMPPMPPMPPMRMHGGMMGFGSMSEAGRKAMTAAMMGDRAANRADHERVRAARDRMLATLDAERVDAAALRRAMDEEREAANAMKARRQAAMATALLSLSAADRKAFVEDARGLRTRVERHIEKRGRHGRTTTMTIMRHGPGDDMEPMEPMAPPPPPAR